jgi:hypothetical protein
MGWADDVGVGSLGPCLSRSAQGPPIFAGGPFGDLEGHLIWIIYSASKPGYR